MLFCAGAWLAAACVSLEAPPEPKKMFFAFNSGSPHHPEGFGAWTVRIEDDRLRIEHQVRDKVTRYPEARLSAQEQTELRELIDAARLEKLPSESPRAIPDQPRVSFTLGQGAASRTFQTSIDWTKTDPLVTLVRRLAALIEKFTGAKPVLA
jgi:hypothetical protein